MSDLDDIKKIFGVPDENITNVPSDHLPKKPMTMSQTLRAVLFRRWERECGPKRMTSDAFYEKEMLRIINIEKNKL